MKAPRKAVVLAAGLGTRMRPLTCATPKPLLPLWGVPLLDHTLSLLCSWGVRDVLLNLHHGADAIVRHVRSRTSAALQITMSFEPRILGTGGALKRAEWFLDEEPFWMINADIAADLDPAPLLRAFARRRTLAALWLTDAAGPRTVELRRGFVADFRSQAPGRPGTCTFCGLQLLSPRIMEFIPTSEFSTIVRAYEQAMRHGYRIAGVCCDKSFWSDLGNPTDYRDAHKLALRAHRQRLPGSRFVSRAALARVRDLRRAGARLEGCVAVGASVAAAAGARVADSVLWDGVRLGAHANVRGGIVGSGVRMAGTVSGVTVRPESAGEPLLPAIVRRLGWPLQETGVNPMGPRGSNRVFYRLYSGQRTAIAITYSLERAENALYVANARALRAAGVPVPRVLADLPAQQACAIEDLGDTALLDLVRGVPPGGVEELYRRIMPAVVRFHIRGAREVARRRLPLSEPFAPRLYRWEHELFADKYLRGWLHLPEDTVRRVLRELGAVARRLRTEPTVLVHRDLQSSNILLRDGQPFFIDIQGMRRGPAVYDLASLLCDPYVSMPSSGQDRLLAEYARLRGIGLRRLQHAFWWGAVQRLVQATGAYARLGAMPETRAFARHIGPGLRMLDRALEHVDNLPSLRRIVRSQLGQLQEVNR